MSFPVVLQVLANLVFAVSIFVIFARLRRPAKDDPRLSKGLQLLSSKIAVLEDLSDRTESQVNQMLTLLDQKSRELQSKIALADQQVTAIRQSMDQSLEVATIFQDKIPHNEIIERQNSVKYIRAARLAHAGVSVAEIAREVDLPISEIEFIAKVNQDSLSFREEELPAWAREPQDAGAIAAPKSEATSMNLAADVADGAAPKAAAEPLSPEKTQLVDRLNKLQFEMRNLDLELAHRSSRNVLPDTTMAFEPPRLDSSSLERLGEEFRRAVEAAEREAQGETNRDVMPSFFEDPTPAPQAPQAPQATSAAGASALAPTASVAAPAPKTVAREVSVPELEAARAAAAALRAKDSTTQPANANTKTIRRVEFPRI